MQIGFFPDHFPLLRHVLVSFPTIKRPFGHENLANTPTAFVPESTNRESAVSGSSHVISVEDFFFVVNSFINK